MGGPAATASTTSPADNRNQDELKERLRSLGYATGITGLWHLGTPDAVSPKRDLKKVDDLTPRSARSPVHTEPRYTTLTCVPCVL